jgi:hypothetical protein
MNNVDGIPGWVAEVALGLARLGTPPRARLALTRLLGEAEADRAAGAVEVADGPRGCSARIRSGPRSLVLGSTPGGTLTYRREDHDRESARALVPSRGRPAWLRDELAWLAGGHPYPKCDRRQLLARFATKCYRRPPAGPGSLNPAPPRPGPEEKP